jgi:hypothetical protein
MRFGGGCATCGTYDDNDHARWCDRNPQSKQYPDRNRFVDPYLKEKPNG